VSRQSQFTTNFNRSFIALITNDTKAMVITPTKRALRYRCS